MTLITRTEQSTVTVSLSRGILHGYSLWLELKVSGASLNPTTTDSILRIIEMAIEYFFRQRKRSVEAFSHLGQIVQKYGIGRRYGRARFFWDGRLSCQRSRQARR
jgi:hypothetical protein